MKYLLPELNHFLLQVPSHRSLMVENGVLDLIFREIKHRFHSLRIKREIGLLLGNLALEESAHEGMVEQGNPYLDFTCNSTSVSRLFFRLGTTVPVHEKVDNPVPFFPFTGCLPLLRSWLYTDVSSNKGENILVFFIHLEIRSTTRDVGSISIFRTEVVDRQRREVSKAVLISLHHNFVLLVPFF